MPGRANDGSNQGNTAMNAAVSYDEAYADWKHDPPCLVGASVAEGITWTKRWDRVFDPSLGAYGQWFAGGRTLNTCHNCLDRHVEAGHGARPALIWDSAMTGKVVTLYIRRIARSHPRSWRAASPISDRPWATASSSTCRWCRKPLSRCSRVRGWEPSIRWCSAASRTAELATRIADAKPKVIVSASCRLEPEPG